VKTSLSITQAIDFYLRSRRPLGFALNIDEGILRSLARYADQINHKGPLTEELVLQWARLPQQVDRLWWARRLVTARRFASFWHAFDPKVQVPPTGVFGPAYRRGHPYIYSADEITNLLDATENLTPVDGLLPSTFRTLLGLLACTGLRISEALKLQTHDFDAAAGTLLIQKSKGGQSRCVPIKPSAVLALKAYQRLCRKHYPRPDSSAFFLVEPGRPLSYKKASHTFGRLRTKLGWTQSPLPRLHDLRHTFAVNRLITWQRQGGDEVGRKILALATYLGHRNIRHTYWYLSAVPELLALASQRLTPCQPREERV
jgi:integrase